MRYQEQVEISSPVSRVFDYMDDVAREPEWQPSLVEASKEPSGPTAVGTRKRYVSEFMGRRIENTYLTTLFERNRRVVYETSPGSVLQAKVELSFEEVGAGTRVTMAVDGKAAGPLRFLPQGLLEGVFRKELQASLDLLRKNLEGAA